MKMPEPIWSMTYSASRRKHHHRCQFCNRVVRDGEQVLMARVSGKRTRVVHDTDACARAQCGGLTTQELMRRHGLEYLAGCGFSAARNELDAIRVAESLNHSASRLH